MRRTEERILCLAVALGAACSLCFSQDARLQRGDALDSNPMVGSGGSNSAQGGTRGIDQLLRANLYVTGQVTGLGAFRGSVPYRPSDQFQIGLPSAGLDDFTRRSVGLQDVLHSPGGVYGAQPYLSRTSTVLGAGGLLSGAASPGTNVPKWTAVTPGIARQLRQDAMTQYRSQLPSPAGRVLSVPIEVDRIPTYATDRAATIADQVTGDADRRTSDPVRHAGPLETRPGAGALFGMMPGERSDRLARDLREMTRPDGHLDLRIDASVDDQYRLGGQQTLDLPSDPNDAQPPVAGSPPGVAKPEQTLSRRNEDVFVDLLLRLRERGDRATPFGRSGSGSPVARLTKDPSTPAAGPAAKSIVEIDPEHGMVVHRLAGLGKDALNRNLTMAEKELKKGRYYIAVEYFQIAQLADEDNPLPPLGMALAYFGAGETYTAGVRIHQAMGLFPPLMRSRIDLAKIMDPAQVKGQLSHFARRLREDPYERRDPYMFLSACYMAWNAGQPSEAVRYAEKLLAVAKDQEILQAYARSILKNEGKDKGAKMLTPLGKAAPAPKQ